MTTPLFRFSTTSYPVGDLEVTSFVGNERISRLFRYVIELRSSIDVDTAAILDEPARFEFVRDSLSIPVHGVLSAFNYLRSDARYHYYQAVLVPQLWTESLSQSSQIYKRQTIVQIIETELESAGLVKGRDFIVDVVGNYPEKDYVCQFKESNFDFVSRLMEFHGIYYYFVHTADVSKMVICDHGNYYGLADSYPEFGAGSDIAFAQNPSRESTYTSIWSLAQSNNRTADAVACPGLYASMLASALRLHAAA